MMFGLLDLGAELTAKHVLTPANLGSNGIYIKHENQ